MNLQASSIRESQFERDGRRTLRRLNNQFATVESYLDVALKARKIYIKSPERREDMAQNITDGFYPKEHAKTPITDHTAFTQQKKFSKSQISALNPTQLQDRFEAAYEVYQTLVEADGQLKVFFRKASTYQAHTDAYFNGPSLDETHVMGSKSHGNMIYLAAHETWKRTVVCYLKFSAFLLNVVNPGARPDYLASTANGFQATQYEILTGEPADSRRSHVLQGQLSFSIKEKRKTFNQEVSFVYDTGATKTSIPFHILQTRLGLQESDFKWDQKTSTAAGPSRASCLRIHYLALHPNIVFRDIEVLVNKGSSCLLGTDISLQFLTEFKKGNKKLFWVKKNNWVEL